MRVVIIFENVGGYHAARLRAAHAACAARGWEMTAIQVTAGTREHPWGDLEREITFKLETLLPSGANPREAAGMLTKRLDELRPGAVAIPGWGFPESRAALSWCRRHKALSILMSESKRDDAQRSWWKEQVKSVLYVRKFDAAIVGGELHREYLIELGMTPERISLGYDVVDNEYFARGAEAARRDAAAARERQPMIPARGFFLAATRLIERKNVGRLIDAYAAYRRAVGDVAAWDLAVCGSGVEESRLRTLVERHGLQNQVHLPGFVAYSQINDWYGLAAAFVHPAVQEQWGLVVNEACAARLPILCSRTIGACHELVRDGENGFVFDPHDVAAMTDALVKTHRLDAEARAEMGAASERIVRRFAPDHFAEGLMRGIDAARDDRWLLQQYERCDGGAA